MWATTATRAPDARLRPRTCMVPPGRLAWPRGGGCRQGRGAARRGHAAHTHRDPSRPQAPWVLGASLPSAQVFCFFAATRSPPPTQGDPEKGYTPTELFLWPCWVGGGPNDGVNVMPYEATWPRFFLLLSVKAQNGGRTSAPRQRSGSARYATRRRVSPLASQHMRCSRSTTTMCAVFFATPPRKVRKPHPRPPTIVT